MGAPSFAMLWHDADRVLAGEDFKHRIGDQAEKPPKKRNFFKKFAELQLSMLQHNVALTASHPYASSPINWPFLISGISFWTSNPDQKQIYLIGNLIGWWTCVGALSLFSGITIATIIVRRRGIETLSECTYASRSCDLSLTQIRRLIFSRAQSAVELGRILLDLLGSALFPLLPHGSPALLTPLPAIPPGFCDDRRRDAELRPLGDCELPHFHPRTTDAVTAS